MTNKLPMSKYPMSNSSLNHCPAYRLDGWWDPAMFFKLVAGNNWEFVRHSSFENSSLIMKKSSYEGLQKNIRALKTPKIEVWENQYPDKEYTVTLETDELTCICPKTGLPDFAKVKIEYIPNKLCVELKSFKLYLIAYRNVGIFHEHLTNKILDDFVKAAKPRFARIEVIMNTRGGIKTIISAEYKTR